MRKKLLITIYFLIVVAYATAQTPSWVWARSAGSVSNDYGNATCSDANGNVYVTGTFQGSSITFGSYTLYNTASGSLDAFIVKYDANGNVIWAASGGGTSNDWAYSISTDANGNVFITGFFQSTSSTFGTITLTNAGIYGDIFLVKYDASGNLIWAKRGGGGENDMSWGISTDLNNNIYITGDSDSDTLIFGNDTIIKYNNYYDIFIVKYDAGGNVLWVKSAGGTQADRGFSVCSDLSGNVYVTGYFQSSAIFGTDTIFASGNTDMFVVKYNANGNEIWAKSALKPSAGNDVMGTGIVSDTNGNLYLTGFFQYSVAFGSDTLGNAGNNSIFLAKYDSNGNALWGKSPGGANNDYGQAICRDVNNNIFITGYFKSSFLNFGGNPVFNANIGYYDIFVASYDASGNALWAKSVGDQDYDYGMGICSAGNSVYITGYFGSYSLDFGGNIITNTGSNDVFLAKLSTVVGMNESFSANDTPLLIFPNPSTTGEFNISSFQLPIENIEVFNMLGEKVYAETIFNETNKKINLKNIPDGIYLVKVFEGEKSYCKKLIVERD